MSLEPGHSSSARPGGGPQNGSSPGGRAAGGKGRGLGGGAVRGAQGESSQGRRRVWGGDSAWGTPLEGRVSGEGGAGHLAWAGARGAGLEAGMLKAPPFLSGVPSAPELSLTEVRWSKRRAPGFLHRLGLGQLSRRRIDVCR